MYSVYVENILFIVGNHFRHFADKMGTSYLQKILNQVRCKIK